MLSVSLNCIEIRKPIFSNEKVSLSDIRYEQDLRFSSLKSCSMRINRCNHRLLEFSVILELIGTFDVAPTYNSGFYLFIFFVEVFEAS